jgi:spore coat protein CotH
MHLPHTRIGRIAMWSLFIVGQAVSAFAQESGASAESEALLDWAEYTYPQLFSPAVQTRVIEGYHARYYTSTGSYLGVRDGVVYGYGAAFAQFPQLESGIRKIGLLADFRQALQADGFAVPAGAKLIVTEAMASDPAGGPDWFELYAAGTEAVALAQYSVKDGNDEREMSALPNLTLQPGEYLVITASETLSSGSNYIVPFNLGSNDRVLLHRNGVLEDDLDWGSGDAPAGYTFGRYPGPLSEGMTVTPTPGSANFVQQNANSMLGGVGTLLSTEVHAISVTFDQTEFETMIAAYTSAGAKEWIEADVTIDGTSYQGVGLRLKGNSSLRSVRTSADPATIPWLIKLDKFDEAQDHHGLEEFVIRSNNSRTALNEAVALELLELAGLASQDAIATRFSVNGGAAVLRLATEHPDDEWMEEEFSTTGALYKAESTGDYSYRGDDPASYDEVFDQEAGKMNADLTPLIQFLQFINEADDATFTSGLGARLDVDSFAVYLAMQDLLNNFDDIDGPGNNSYLYYDTQSEQFTVVPWDYNLAFGQMIGGIPGGGEIPGDGTIPGGGMIPGGGIQPPTDIPPGGITFPGRGELPTGTPPTGIPPTGGMEPGDIQFPGGPGGFGNRANILVQRFLANTEWNALYEQKKAELTFVLYASGAAQDVLDIWQETVARSELVDAATIAAEAQAIGEYFAQ